MGFVPSHWPNAHLNVAAWYVFCLATSSISAADCLAACVRRSRVPVGSSWEETSLPSRRAPEPGQDSGASRRRLSSHGQKSVSAGFLPILLLSHVLFGSGEGTGSAILSVAVISGHLLSIC